MRPFPIAELRKLTVEHARELSAWARSAPIGALLSRGRDARGWLGASLELSPGAPVVGPCDVHREGAFCLLEGEPRVGLWLDPGIAAALIERALGGEHPAPETRGPMGELERGVLAYTIARWLGPGDWCVAAVLTSGAPLHEAVAPELSWPLRLTLGTAHGWGELWLRRQTNLARAPRRALPDWIPIEASLVAGYATLDASEVAGLSIGDAVIPDELFVDAGLRGELLLYVAAAALTIRCRSAAGLTIVGIEDHSRPITKAATPGSKETSQMNDEVITKMARTPVTLHVEVGRLELTLGEVASLAVGEVVRTGRKLTSEVTLRAGDRVVARGELVDVEGELGVQITELMG